jgi:two-component system response regulator AtoC
MGPASTALPPIPPLEILAGRTSVMQTILSKIKCLGQTSVPVLFQGESGTGKEVWARLLHTMSTRPGSLVKVSCPAIPAHLFESELFGYERGAFTGAQTPKRGRIEEADGGTLLLDEVGSLDISIQSKLLQLLDDGTYLRVGGHEPRRIVTRLISTSNEDLRRLVAGGAFRLDLLFRINAVTITIPPLRERLADIPALASYFIACYAESFRQQVQPLSQAAIEAMRGYHWPGNIRQLENMIRSYVMIGSEQVLLSEMSSPVPASPILSEFDPNQPISLREFTRKATQELERHVILKVLEANLWNRQKTARSLKISYRCLLYKLTEAGFPETTMGLRPN